MTEIFSGIEGSFTVSGQSPTERKLADTLRRTQNQLRSCSGGYEHLNRVTDQSFEYITALEKLLDELGIELPEMEEKCFKWRMWRKTKDGKWLL